MSPVEKFLQSPSPDQLVKFKKDELLEIGKMLELDVTWSMHKANLVRLIGEQMIDNDIFPDEIMDHLPALPLEMSQAQLELEKTCIMAQAENECAKAQVTAKTEQAKIQIEKA